MKKLLILSLIAFFALSSAKVFADGVNPVAGAIHQYWVDKGGTGTDANSNGIWDDHEGNYYTWFVTDGSGFQETDALSQTDFSFTSGYKSRTQNLNQVEIKWNASSIGKTFFLVVIEEGANSCKNVKVQPIYPTNNFDLVFTSLDENSQLADDPNRCAPDVAVSATDNGDGTYSIGYDYGESDLLFSLTPSGIDSKWYFTPTLNITKGNATETLEWSDDGTNYTSFTSGSPIEVPAGTTTVLVRVKLTNSSAEEGTGGQSVLLTLTDMKDEAGNLVQNVYDNASNAYSADPQQTQTINARPATSTIGYN